MSEKKIPKELLILKCGQQKKWADWLAKNHAISSGVWLQLAKKSADTNTVSYAEALETALCFGWIDGQKKAYDEQFWLQKFTRRSSKSMWSQINKDKAVTLIEAGKMHAAGMEEVERAKSDGRWDAAYAPASKANVPDDLQAALDENPRAKDFFGTLDSANRYAILFRIQAVKKPETRAKKIVQFIEMLARHEKIHKA